MPARQRAFRCDLRPSGPGYRAVLGIPTPFGVYDAVVDTGAVVSLISRTIIDEIDPQMPMTLLDDRSDGKTRVAGGKFVHLLVRLEIQISNADGTAPYPVQLRVKILERCIEWVGQAEGKQQPDVPPVIGLHSFMPSGELRIEPRGNPNEGPECWITITDDCYD